MLGEKCTETVRRKTRYTKDVQYLLSIFKDGAHRSEAAFMLGHGSDFAEYDSLTCEYQARNSPTSKDLPLGSR